MAVTRPGFVPNVQANVKALESRRTFVDVKPDSILIARFLPPAFSSGQIFVRTMNHYNFQQPDDKSRGMALACLAEHGTEETGDVCKVCELMEIAEDLKDKDPVMKKIAANQGGHPARPRWYGQILIGEKVDGEMKYEGPYLLALPKTAAEDVVGILKTNEAMGEAYFTDPDKGQAVLVTRNGSGLNTRYKVERSGLIASLDDIFPNWTEKYLDAAAFMKKLALNVVTPDEQKAAIRDKHGEAIDWAMLEENYGF